MYRIDGQVAVITGGGRSQGRSHALALARQGADIVVCDIGGKRVASAPYAMASAQDLAETVRLVEELDRRAIAVPADVRDGEQMQRVVDTAIAEFGQIDILLANAGILSFGEIQDLTDQAWRDMIDINLSGVFNSVRAVTPHMRSRRYGRIVATSSVAGRGGFAGIGHYVAAKWGVIGLIKSLSMEVAKDGITANVVAPSSVNTYMIDNDAIRPAFGPGIDHPTMEDVELNLRRLNPAGIGLIEAEDVSNAIVYLVSPEARYVNGSVLAVTNGQISSNSS